MRTIKWGTQNHYSEDAITGVFTFTVLYAQ